MKKIYFILDDNKQVIDFTEEINDFYYGTIPKEMTIMSLKQALDFENSIYVFENNTLTSRQIPKTDNEIKQLTKEVVELISKNKKMETQITTLSQQDEFHENLIMEMAGVVYG